MFPATGMIQNQPRLAGHVVMHDNWRIARPCSSTGQLGFDSGERAGETATTSKEEQARHVLLVTFGTHNKHQSFCPAP